MTSADPTIEPTALAISPRHRSRKARILSRLIICLAAFYVAWCLALYFFQDRMLFPRDLAPAPDARTDRYDKRTAVMTLPIESGGQIVAWFIPAPGPARSTPAPVVIFFHGNAEIIDFLDEIVEPYRRLGFSVFLPEYRGYGRSSGTPDEKHLIADAVRFYDELIKRPDVDPARIVIHARSLGGGPACGLAAQRACKAMVLQSIFTSTNDLANRYGAPGFLARYPFDNGRIIPTLNVPLLIAHGLIDEIVPVSHGRTLAKLAKHATYLEYNCKHNGFPGEGKEDEYWQKVPDFLRTNGLMAGTKQ